MRFMMTALAAVLAAGGVAQAASLETYNKLPSMRMPTISPDGSRIAFVQSVGGKEALVIDQLDPPAVLGNIPPRSFTYGSLIWLDSSHLAAQANVGAVELVDLDHHKVGVLGEKTEVQYVRSLPLVREIGGRTTVFLAGPVGGRGSTVLESVDLASGNAQRLDRVDGGLLVDWHIDPDGNLIGQSTYDTKTHEWKLQVRRNGTWIDSYSVTALVDPPTVVTMTPDAKALVLQRVTEDQGLEFRRVSLEDGKLGELVPEYRDVKDVLYDPQTHRPIGGLKISLDHTYVFFDPKDRALWDGVVKLFPDEEVQMVSWSKDRGKVVVRVTGLNHGVSYYVVDTAAHKAVGIGNLIEGLGPKDLAGIAMVTYPAKDGLPIQALLTLPNGREPKNLPLIVLPHAGPVASDEVGYNGTAQALASRGYAVLQPEFRGSNGLGWKLESAGFGEWGRKMQTDLSDGVRALASKGYIDPKRVCIVGAQGGYSGYAALAGVMFEHDVYRCAVAVNPWTDIRKLAGGIHADTKGSINVRNWERFIGAKDQRDPVFDQISPSDHAAEASAPILIIHPWGSDDSVRMTEALQRAKKPVELVSLKTNDNKATGEALSLQALQATIAFLEKNNPPN